MKETKRVSSTYRSNVYVLVNRQNCLTQTTVEGDQGMGIGTGNRDRDKGRDKGKAKGHDARPGSGE